MFWSRQPEILKIFPAFLQVRQYANEPAFILPESWASDNIHGDKWEFWFEFCNFLFVGFLYIVWPSG